MRYIAFLIACLLSSPALSQSSGNFTNGPPPLSAQQLNSAFQRKADYPYAGPIGGVVITGPAAVGLVPIGTGATTAVWAPLPGSFSGFANPTAQIGLTAVNGSATTAMRSDAAPAINQGIAPTWTGLHTFSAGLTGAVNGVNVTGTPSVGYVPIASSSSAAAWGALPGSFSGFANPTGTIGLTAVNGSATTAMRSDAAPALSQAITPVWTGLHIFNAGISNAGNPSSVISNPGLNNWFFGSTIYGGNTAFITTYAPGFLDAQVAGLTIAAPLANIGGLITAQSSQKTLADGFTQQIPMECISVLDSFQTGVAAIFNGAWCGYSQMNLLAATDPLTTGGTYGAIGHELSINNAWTYVAVDPYSYNAAGSTHLVRADCLTNIKCGAAFEVIANGAIMGSAFLVGNGAVDTTRGGIGSTTVGQAYSMASNQALSWFCSAATLCAQIYQFTASTSFLHFGVPTNGTFTFDVNGNSVLGVNAGVLYPVNDNAYSIGTSSFRMESIYAVNYYAGAGVEGVTKGTGCTITAITGGLVTGTTGC